MRDTYWLLTATIGLHQADPIRIETWHDARVQADIIAGEPISWDSGDHFGSEFKGRPSDPWSFGVRFTAVPMCLSYVNGHPINCRAAWAGQVPTDLWDAQV